MSQPTNTIGPFNRITVLHRASMVELCTGFDRSGRPVTIVALSPEAGADPHWCAEFADLVSKDGTALGPMDSTIHETDLYGTRPWAASYPEPGRRGAERLLAHLPGAIPEGTDPSSLLPSSGILDALNAGGRPPTDGPFAPPRAGYGPPAQQPPTPPQEQYPSPYARPPAGAPTSGGAPGYGQQPAGNQAGPASAPPAGYQPSGYQPPGYQPSGYQPPQPAAYPQNPGYPQATGYPAAAAPPPQKSGGKGGLIAAVIAGVLVIAFLAVLGGVGVYKAMSDPDDKPTASPSRSSTPSPTPTPSSEPTPSGTPSPSATAAPGNEAEPTLKSVAAVSVVGPTWTTNDSTYTMTFKGWPFAFRTPGNFGCLKASNPPPGGAAWVCVAESAGPKGRLAVIYRPCPTTCTAAEQKKLDQDWLDAPVQYRAKDASTRYNEKTAAKYELTFSHYFGAGPGQPLKYQVAVFASSTPAEKAYMQKTVNDIRTQTP